MFLLPLVLPMLLLLFRLLLLVPSLSGQSTHILPFGSLDVLLCTGIYWWVERCSGICSPFSPRGGINFIVLLQGLTNCTTHSHTLAHKKNTHPRTRHNLKHAFQGTLIGISGKVDVSYLPLLCHSPG